MTDGDSITRDVTGALPEIVRQGLLVAKYDCGLSRTQLRKLGLLPRPWAKKLGWTGRGTGR